MVNSILQYIEPQLKAYMQFLNRVDSPVFRISNGEMIKGDGQEKEVVTISDLNGNSLYIRQTQPETINERKALSSCDKEYNISARCKVVFYSFGGNDFTINPDKVKSKIINTLARLDFSHYTGSSTEIKIDINGNSLDMEKIYTEETGKEFSGNVWPTLVSVDFTLSYVDTNCNTCDIDDNETVVTWTPDFTPENCETKAICEAVANCQVIKDLQDETASLQEQIDNLPTSGLTCEDLPNCEVIQIIESDLSSHVTNTNNPHSTTLDQVTSAGNTTTNDVEFGVVSAKNIVIKGVNGQGHVHFRHQATDPTGTGQSTTVWADVNGNIKWLNDGLYKTTLKTSTNSADREYTFMNRDGIVADQQYVNDEITAAVAGLLDDRGNFDASVSAYPSSGGSGPLGAILKGDLWTVSVPGTISGVDVSVGDVIRCLTDIPGQTQSNWAITENNLGYVAENSANKTSTVVGNETSTSKYLTVKGVYDWVIGLGYLTASLAASTYQAILTSANFGSFITGLTTKNPPVDADEFVFNDVSGGNVAKKSTWLQIKTAISTAFYLDATSSIQTQFDALNNKTLFKTTSNSSTHTGTLSNTIIYSEDISGKLASGDIAEIVSDVVRVSGSTSTTIRYYLNSSNSLSGATAIGVYTYGFSGLNIADFRRQLIVKSSTSIRVKGTLSSLLNDYSAFSNYTDVTVNLASLHIIFAITLGNTGDQFLVSSRKMTK